MCRLVRLLVLSFSVSAVGCGDEDACEDGALGCSGDVLSSCKDGAWLELEDCAASEEICHDMGDDSHCMPEGAMDEM